MNSLEGYLPKTSIHDDLTTRLAYARDASMYRLLPEAVTKPKNESEVKQLLKYGRETKTPITFRTAGSSLSGQSITMGIIAEVLYDWQQFKILDEGDAIWCQPGVNGAVANKMLSPYFRKIGPDPASINTARIGGIVSNNSSGMVCGTQFNAYHTLNDISFILTNGNQFDTNKLGDHEKFQSSEQTLADGLMNIKKEIESNPHWVQKIRDKYRIKNTIGYSLNSFLDYDHPLDIFSHLLVGAEGTLAFIASVVLNTIPDPPEKGTGLILFKSPEEGGIAVPFFKDLGAAAIEFMDDQSLRTAKHFENPPYDPQSIPDDVTALLVEFQEESQDEIERLIHESRTYSEKDSSVIQMQLVTEEKDRDTIWKIRKGLYPTIGSMRETGTSIITEDIAVDTENLAEAIRDLKKIFNVRQFHDGVIFGHARDGNLHFITSVDLDDKTGVMNYEGMMDDLSDMTLGKFNGSLKAEHGTGRNMAAFVETEWGGPLYEIMWKVKQLADPDNIMNPDVLLNRDQKIHLKDLKPMPKVHDEVDQCIECGFCERICPSRGFTFTPRQRIAIMRESQLNPIPKSEIEKFNHYVSETCATDGLCEIDCPVNINTGKMVKDIRVETGNGHLLANLISTHFSLAIRFIRMGIHILNLKQKLLGPGFFNASSKWINQHITSLFPIWPKSGITLAKTPNFIHRSWFLSLSKDRVGGPIPDYLLFPSCAGRVIASDHSGTSSTDYLLKIAENAGIKIQVLESFNKHCCGMAFESHGHKDIGENMQQKLLRQLETVSKQGAIPIILDMSPCTQFLHHSGSKLVIMDSVQFLTEIKDNLQFETSDESVFAHPVCSSQKMGNGDDLVNLVKSCTRSVETSTEPFCCGTGGDRVMLAPELPKNAVQRSVNGISASKGASSSRNCELGLTESTGIKFSSIESLVYHAIKK